VPVLYFTEHRAVKAHWGSGGIAPCILDLGGEVSGLLHAPAAFPPRERFPGSHWIGSCEGLRAGLDAVVKRKIRGPCQDSNTQSSSL
jgi:hypothetical protein